ncbi:hypothetical protein ACLBR5_02885 [Escherichia coli]
MMLSQQALLPAYPKELTCHPAVPAAGNFTAVYLSGTERSDRRVATARHNPANGQRPAV